MDLEEENWIYQYYNEIKTGNIIVGKWIKLLYEYIVDGLANGLFFYNENKANEVIDWIEAHCFHTEGPLAPQPIKLELFQKAFYACQYGIVDENGCRQFREVLFVEGRKNGKSKTASCQSAYEWRNGGYGSRVICVAPKLDQADLIYNDIWQMTTLDPEYVKLKEVLSEKDQHNKKVHDDSELPRHRVGDLAVPAKNSTVKKLPFSHKRADGFNPSLCVCDEISSWPGDAGLKTYEVMKSSMGARPEAILLSCTTSGYVNDGIYDELIKRATRFLLGESKETKFLPFLYMIDDIDKWDDMEELHKANPNLGISVSEAYMREEIAVAEGSLSKKAEFLTKYCNIKQNSSTAWLSTQTVQKCMGKPMQIEDFAHNYCVAGIDLSQTTDLTSACVVIDKDGESYVFSKYWLPSQKIDEATERDGIPYQLYVQRGLLEPSGDNFIDYHDCFNWLVSLVEEYEILPLMVGYDRYSAQYLIQDLQNYGFRCDSVFQGENLWGTLQSLEGMMKDGKIHFGDNDITKAHLLNSAIKMSVERGRGKLVKVSPMAHVDGVAALADALVVKEKWYNETGHQLKNER